ncbi:hypothetical protein KAH43_07860 [Candidatus Bipolaricaulota bacterium]|nr:hypothetical protein [Candidatus Bipolaricaulota bacterium]
MIRATGTGLVLAVILLAGCMAPGIIPSVTVQLEIVEEDQGWVQVRVTGIESSGYVIHWGDADAPYGVTSIALWEELYEHFYQAVLGETSGQQVPTTYQITVVDSEGIVVAQQAILIAAVVCHLELISLNGREVSVEYWGRFGIEYSISWGDRFADHVMVSTQSSRGTASHTYAAPGTYSLGMEEIWAPTQIFFTIEVE